jgi:dCTP diphosphatase
MGGDLERLQRLMREFADERDWQQFHTPRNLATALSIEASELLEHFQWLRPQDTSELPDEKRQPVSEEMADVLLYLLRLSDVTGIDLVAAADAKLVANAKKYPADKVRGSSRKYTDYRSSEE